MWKGDKGRDEKHVAEGSVAEKMSQDKRAIILNRYHGYFNYFTYSYNIQRPIKIKIY